MKCIIIGAGELNTKEIINDNSDFVIASDGGYIYCKELNIKPNLIVGDLDSIDELPKDIETIKFNPIKDETDTYLAIKEGMKRGYKEFILYGCLGKRLEHTLANIQIMVGLLKEDASIELMDDNTYIKILKKNDELLIKENINGYISLFSYTNKSVLTIDGLKYNVKRKTITNKFPLGIDNETTNTSATIKIHKGIVILIISKINEENRIM